MGLENERNRRAEKAEFESIRMSLADDSKKNYESFKTGDKNSVTLIVVRFSLDKPMSIVSRNGHTEYILPYGNLDELIKKGFEDDRSDSIPEIEMKEVVPFAPFKGMPGGYGIQIGDKVLQKTTFYALESVHIDEKRMVIATRFSNHTDLEQKRPFLEYWKAEKRGDTDYLFGKENPVALVTSGSAS